MHRVRSIALLLLVVLPSCDRDKDKNDVNPAGHSRTAVGGSGRPAAGDPPLSVDQRTKLSAVANRYSEDDPTAGLVWAKGLKDPAAREAALSEIAWSCTGSNLSSALEAADALSVGDSRSKLAAHLVAEWSQHDAATALDWAKSRQDPEERDEAIGGWVTAMGETAPAQAGTLAVDEIRPGVVQNRSIVAVLQRWAQTDPVAAREWVDEFPEGPVKNDALRELQVAASK